MIKVTLEFESADQAIVALGKIVGAPVASRAWPAKSPIGSTEVGPDAPTTKRRGRSDKGQPRGSYKDSATTQAAAPAEKLESTDLISPVPAAAAPAPEQPPVVGSPPAPVPAKIEDAQAAIAKVFNEKKIDVAMQVLSRFGCKAVRELQAGQYAEFIQKCNDVLAGGAV